MYTYYVHHMHQSSMYRCTGTHKREGGEQNIPGLCINSNMSDTRVTLGPHSQKVRGSWGPWGPWPPLLCTPKIRKHNVRFEITFIAIAVHLDTLQHNAYSMICIIYHTYIHIIRFNIRGVSYSWYLQFGSHL